jgi:hypothetical protein
MKKSLQILKICLTIVMITPIGAHADNFVRAVQAGGTGFDKGSAITTDGEGNTLITGYFQGTATFGGTDLVSAGFKDIFIAKTDNQGNFLWAIKAGGSFEDEGLGIVTDSSNNIIVTGFFFESATFEDTTLTSDGSYDIFVVKYDAEGNLLWARSDGGSSLDRGYAISVDGLGNSYTTGYFSSTASIGDSIFTSVGQDDIFIVKYDVDGAFIWAEQVGGQFFDQGYSITTDPEGNAIVTGRFSGSVDFGDTTLTSTRLFNTFITKYDANGNYLWARKAGGKDDFAFGITSDAQGNSLVTGYFQETGNFNGILLTSAGSGDIFIAKYDQDGSLLWVRQAGGDDLDMGYCITTDDEGNTSVSGFFVGTATFEDTTLTSTFKDIFIAKYDVDGNLLQAIQAEGSGTDEGYGIATDGTGNTFLTGLFEGEASFGNITLDSDGEEDVFIAKFGPGDATGVEEEINHTQSFNLSQNYPNPFNPQTTINYYLKTLSEVQLTIYDIRGREIKTLINYWQNAGQHSVTLDASDFASGFYIYRLKAGSFEKSRKMLLLR